MLESATIIAFCSILITCVALDASIVYALIVGLVLFFGYSLIRGFGFRQTAIAALSGSKTLAGICFVMLLIGMLTASWRACGTIAFLVSHAMEYITPEAALAMCFVFNTILSTLTGTSFGTAATMGVVCMTMTEAMGIPTILSGGAILAGCFVGDRCSPVSTSASLVCAVTGTNIYRNMRLMCITGIVPFLLSVAIYSALGMAGESHATDLNISGLFAKEFNLSAWCLVPAIVLIGFMAFRASIRITMVASMLSAVFVAVSVQELSPLKTAMSLITGFEASDQAIAKMINGGGLVSMVKVCVIIMISSTFSGIFKLTGMLDGIKNKLPGLSARISPFGTVVATATVSAAIACNQVLAVMLTRELCSEVITNRQHMAIALEDSAIVIAPLLPWSIACAVPLATINAPASSVLAATFLYLLPVVGLYTHRKLARIID